MADGRLQKSTVGLFQRMKEGRVRTTLPGLRSASLFDYLNFKTRKNPPMNLNEFHKANITRQSEAFAPPNSIFALVLCVQEEVGELASAVLGVTGEKKRKAHLTKEDVLDAVADTMTYLSLVAASAGCEDLEKLLADTFNMVSRRAGSNIFIEE